MQNKQPGSIVGIARDRTKTDRAANIKKTILIKLKPQKMYSYSSECVFRKQRHRQQFNTCLYRIALRSYSDYTIECFTCRFYIEFLLSNQYFLVNIKYVFYSKQLLAHFANG